MTGKGLRATKGASECVWAGKEIWRVWDPVLGLPSLLWGKYPTTDRQGGRVLQSNCSLHSWRDPGSEVGGDLLKATSSELELDLGLIQGPGFHSLLPICGWMD